MDRLRAIREKAARRAKRFGFSNEPSDDIERFLRKHSVFSHTAYIPADVSEIVDTNDLEQIGMGIHQRVFRIKDTNWIVKEGRWDLSMEFPILGHADLPSWFFDRLWRFFGAQPLNPHIWHVLEEYRTYLEFTHYFGFFENDSVYFHPNRDLIFMTQKNIRSSLLLFKPEIEREYGINLNGKLSKIFTEDVRFHNFLPREYLVIGKSLSKQNKGRTTSLIFQEFVPGHVVREISDQTLNEKSRRQLVLLIYLILLMHMQIRLVPDTRPRYAFFEVYNWLTKTDNIIVSGDGLKFIDTRWFWDTKSKNLLRKGFIIPHLTMDKCKFTLLKLLEDEFV